MLTEVACKLRYHDDLFLVSACLLHCGSALLVVGQCRSSWNSTCQDPITVLCMVLSSFAESSEGPHEWSSRFKTVAWLCMQCGDGEHARIVSHRLHSQRSHPLPRPAPQESHPAVLRCLWRAAASVPPHQGAGHVPLHLRLHRQGAPLWPCCLLTQDALALKTSRVVVDSPQVSKRC